MPSSPLWKPSDERIANANITRFAALVHERFKTPVDSYDSLHRWSVDYPERFWTSVWEFCEVRADKQWTTVLENPTKMPGASWFAGAELNFAANLLRYADDTPALIFRNERAERREISFKTLCAEVARIASGLRDAGVKPGDRVA